MDCMQGMKEFPDKYFDLAIVDPPYGIKRLENPKGRLEKYGDTAKANNSVPTEKYFDELFRVSKNQIIWGANYFNMPPCRDFVCWYKHQPVKIIQIASLHGLHLIDHRRFLIILILETLERMIQEYIQPKNQ